MVVKGNFKGNDQNEPVISILTFLKSILQGEKIVEVQFQCFTMYSIVYYNVTVKKSYNILCLYRF